MASQYKVNVINNARKADYANPLAKYVQTVADKYGFNVNVAVKQHKEMNAHLREHGDIAKDHKADGYMPSGGEGHYTPEGTKHKATGHPRMKRSNRLYEHLTKQGAKMHGVCEGYAALLQTAGVYMANSGKLNSQKEEGLRHKYLATKDDAKRLKGKKRFSSKEYSKGKHEDTEFLAYWEKGNVSGSQHHPEQRQSTQDEQDVIHFLEKVTGQKPSAPLEERVEEGTEKEKKD